MGVREKHQQATNSIVWTSYEWMEYWNQLGNYLEIIHALKTENSFLLWESGVNKENKIGWTRYRNSNEKFVTGK